jgi:hypothetical protein
MDWLFDHFQFVIIIGLAFASWLKSRADAKRAEREEREARDEMAGDDDDYEPEEEWQLPPAMPSGPPPLTPKATPPPLYVDTSEAHAILKRQQEIQDRLQAIRNTKATTTGNAAETRARIAAEGKPKGPAILGNTSLRSSLRDPKQTRRAIVLREILGPPVGLR